MNKKEINVIFTENIDILARNQAEYFHRELSSLKKVETAIKKDIMEKKEISDLINDTFSLKADNDITINFYCETLVAETTSKKRLNSESLKKVKNLLDKYDTGTNLYVVDLCLDSEDNNPDIGRLVGRKIIEEKKEGLDVLYMTGNINLWNGQDGVDGHWQVYRAVKGNKMNEFFEASAASVYTKEMYSRMKQDNPMFDLIKYLLCSKYYNRQYIGVVLLKACTMDM